jgi:hypothetical protein
MIVPSKDTNSDGVTLNRTKQVNMLNQIGCLGQLLTKSVALETSQLPMGSLKLSRFSNKFEKFVSLLTSQLFMLALQ